MGSVKQQLTAPEKPVPPTAPQPQSIDVTHEDGTRTLASRRSITQFRRQMIEVAIAALNNNNSPDSGVSFVPFTAMVQHDGEKNRVLVTGQGAYKANRDAVGFRPAVVIRIPEISFTQINPRSGGAMDFTIADGMRRIQRTATATVDFRCMGGSSEDSFSLVGILEEFFDVYSHAIRSDGSFSKFAVMSITPDQFMALDKDRDEALVRVAVAYEETSKIETIAPKLMAIRLNKTQVPAL